MRTARRMLATSEAARAAADAPPAGGESVPKLLPASAKNPPAGGDSVPKPSGRQYDAVSQLLRAGEASAWTRRRPQPTAKQRVSAAPAQTISALACASAAADYRLDTGEVTGHTDTGRVGGRWSSTVPAPGNPALPDNMAERLADTRQGRKSRAWQNPQEGASGARPPKPKQSAEVEINATVHRDDSSVSIYEHSEELAQQRAKTRAESRSSSWQPPPERRIDWNFKCGNFLGN